MPVVVVDAMPSDRIAITNGKDIIVVNNVKTTKSKKSNKSSTINRDNPCSSCPALSTKDERFVDGEGSGKNQWAVVALEC